MWIASFKETNKRGKTSSVARRGRGWFASCKQQRRRLRLLTMCHQLTQGGLLSRISVTEGSQKKSWHCQKMCHQLTQGGRHDNSWRGFQPRGGARIIVGEGRGYQLEEFQKRVSVTEYRGVSEIGAFKILSLPKRCHQLTQGGRHDDSWRGVS